MDPTLVQLLRDLFGKTVALEAAQQKIAALEAHIKELEAAPPQGQGIVLQAEAQPEQETVKGD